MEDSTSKNKYTDADSLRKIQFTLENHIRLLVDRLNNNALEELEEALTKGQLGELYLRREQGSRLINLDKSIRLTLYALSVFKKENQRRNIAIAHWRLSQAYLQSDEKQKPYRTELSIRHARHAAGYFSQAGNEYEAGMLFGHLGDAFRKRQKGDSAQNARASIVCYRRTLQLIDSEQSADVWLQTQLNISTAYLDAGHLIRERRIEFAIRHAEKALSWMRKYEISKIAIKCFMQTALLFSIRISGRKKENKRRAIELYSAALKLVNDDDKEKLFRINAALGFLFSDFHEGNLFQHLDQAADKFYIALKYCKNHDDQTQKAGLEAALGSIYLRKLSGGREQNLNRAIEHTRNALAVFRKSNAPQRWARLQLQLGNAYFSTFGTQKPIDAHAAERCFERARLVLNRHKESHHYLEAQRKLAELALLRGDYEEAINLLSAAMGGCSLPKFSQLPIEEQQYTSLEVSRNYSRRAYAHILMGNVAQCIQYINKSKIASECKNHVSELKHIEDIDIGKLVDSAPQKGALVIPIISALGSAVVFITSDVTNIEEAHVEILSSLTEQRIQALMIGREEEVGRGGWLGSFPNRKAIDGGQAQRLWPEQLNQTCNDLWGLLMGPIFKTLSEIGLQEGADVLLLPSTLLSLLPLHAASGPHNGRTVCFIEKFALSLVPTLSVLIENGEKGSRPPSTFKLASIIDPAGDFRFAAEEGRKIGNFFPAAARVFLGGEAATKRAVFKVGAECTHLHFICHGYHDWSDARYSYLSLAGQECLGVGDIEGGPWGKDLRVVTLSSCEAGIVDVRLPDGHLSLPGAFIRAGVPAAIGTLWEIDDRSGMRLMVAFYCHHIQKGLGPSAALRRAQLEIRAELKQRALHAEASTLRLNFPGAHVTQDSNEWTWAAFQCWGC